MTQYRRNLGKIGEQRACEYLQKKGYQILQQNYKTKLGEIDILAIDNDCLVFVEVKTRWSDQFGLPEEAVSARKVRSITKTGEYYKLTHPRTPDLMRLDVIAVELSPKGRLFSLRHHQNVTG